MYPGSDARWAGCESIKARIPAKVFAEVVSEVVAVPGGEVKMA